MSNELTTSLASSKANTSIARWYAVQVASSCEKKVKAKCSEIIDFTDFYYAEEYHQQYLFKNPRGYCGLGGCGVTFKK